MPPTSRTLLPRSAPFGSAILLSALTACAGWSRVPSPWPGPLDPGVRLQVWSGGESVILCEVTVGADSLRGFPVSRDSTAHTEPVAWAREQVDSLRTISPERPHRFGYGFLTGVLAGAGAMFGLILGLSADDS